MLSLSFAFKKRVAFGRGLYLVGNLPELGAWNPRHSVKLFWKEGHNWTQTVTIELPAGLARLSVEYKFLATRFDRIDLGDLDWEPGPNRVSEVHLCALEGSSSSSTLTPTGPQPREELLASPAGRADFRKKKKPCQLAKSPSPLAVRSLDCGGLAASALFDQLQRTKATDFVLLQRVKPAWLRSAWAQVPRHMAYFDEEEEELPTCVLLYDFARWRFIQGDALLLGNECRGIWGVFISLSTGEKVAVSSIQSADCGLQSGARFAALFKKVAACVPAITLDKFIGAADSNWRSKDGQAAAGAVCSLHRGEAAL